MTRQGEGLTVEEKTVVAIDVCSSSDIMEDLLKTGNIDKWRDLLIRLKDVLDKAADRLDFQVYKFTGDGWILLFDYDYSGRRLLFFLSALSVIFDSMFFRSVEKLLDSPPETIGLTFGLDRGSLVRFVMRDRTEYIGRPINVACRLQGAIKEKKDDEPEYKALMTMHLYSTMRGKVSEFLPVRARRTLRNINGGRSFQCMKLTLVD